MACFDPAKTPTRKDAPGNPNARPAASQTPCRPSKFQCNKPVLHGCFATRKQKLARPAIQSKATGFPCNNV